MKLHKAIKDTMKQIKMTNKEQKRILKKFTDEELAMMFIHALRQKVDKTNILNEIKSRKPSAPLISAILHDLTL